MEVYERIVQICQNRNINNKEFGRRLLALEPKLSSTGKTPSLQTIVKYLSGERELRVELVPYISRVLDVEIDELFYGKKDLSSSQQEYEEEVTKKIMRLLPYVPTAMNEHIIKTLEDYEEYYLKKKAENIRL